MATTSDLPIEHRIRRVNMLARRVMDEMQLMHPEGPQWLLDHGVETDGRHSLRMHAPSDPQPYTEPEANLFTLGVAKYLKHSLESELRKSKKQRGLPVSPSDKSSTIDIDVQQQAQRVKPRVNEWLIHVPGRESSLMLCPDFQPS